MRMMEPTVQILINIGISAVMSIIVLYFVDRKASKTIEKTEAGLQVYMIEAIKDAGQGVVETINSSLTEQLDPILKVNSQAMSIIGKAGASANQVKMMERQIIEAVNQDLPISPDMIESFSPALAETLRKYPELMPKAIAAYQKIMGDGGFDLGGGSRARTHPLSNRRPEV